jgi:hypothetical protein
MDLGGFLDVLLGLALLYLLLALVCSAVNEILATVFGWRAKTLREGVRKLLDDKNAQSIIKMLNPEERKPPTLESIESHALMKGLRDTAGRHGPSYIPGRIFATALLDTVLPDSSSQSRDPLAEAKTTLDKLPETNVKGALLSMLKEAEGNREKLRAKVASWFDDSMDRVTGVYKRKLHLFTFISACVVTLVMNADTFHVAGALWNDTSLRAQVVEVAGQVGKDGTASETIDSTIEKLRPFPIGWLPDVETGLSKVVSSPSNLGIRLLGWLLTIIAVSLGAPFWFDILQRLNVLRATGRRPAREDEAAANAAASTTAGGQP